MEQLPTPLTEELSERLAAPAGTTGRDALLRRLADVLGARGLYHQAAKRLAHAGDKVYLYLLKYKDFYKPLILPFACSGLRRYCLKEERTFIFVLI